MNNDLMNFNSMSDTELEMIHKQSTTVQISRLKEKIEALVIDTQKQNERISTIETNVNKRMVIDYAQSQSIRNAKNKRVEYLWANGIVNQDIHDTKAKLHAAAWKDLKDSFGVNSYHNIKEKDFDEALNFAKNWRPRLV